MSIKQLFDQLTKYTGKYHITFQFWGEGHNNFYIEKDDIGLKSSGGYDTPEQAMKEALEYLNRINRNQ